MKSKRYEICIPAMHEAYRRIFGTDAPAVVVLACEDPRIRHKVEYAYEEIMRERALRRILRNNGGH